MEVIINYILALYIIDIQKEKDKQMAKHARGKPRKSRTWGKNVGDPNSKKGR